MEYYKDCKYKNNFTLCYGTDKTNLKVVELHPNTKKIMPGAFNNIPVEKVVFNKNLEIISLGAFNGSHIEFLDLSIPKNLKIDSNAFTYNQKLKKVIFGDNIDTIQPYCFSHCVCLKEIDLSNTKITGLGADCFRECSNLESIILPQTLKVICAYAFANTNLEKIDLPNSIEAMYQSIFMSTPLKEINLPDNLKTFGTDGSYENFLAYSNIEKVYYNNINPDVLEKIDKLFEELHYDTQLIKMDLEYLLNSKSFKEANEILHKIDVER